MGVVIIDHSHGPGIDHKAGRKMEYESKQCKHCGAVIAILYRPLGQRCYLSSTDVARTTEVAKDLPDDYVGKRQCCKCKGNLCRACHAAQPQCVTLSERRDVLHQLRDRVRKGVPLEEALKEV